jgi:hypothetical protein
MSHEDNQAIAVVISDLHAKNNLTVFVLTIERMRMCGII